MIYKALTPQTLFDIQNRDGLVESKWIVRISPNGVRYRWDGSNKVDVEVIIQEEASKYEHSRTITLNTNGGSWDEQRVVNEVLAYLGDNFEMIIS